MHLDDLDISSLEVVCKADAAYAHAFAMKVCDKTTAHHLACMIASIAVMDKLLVLLTSVVHGSLV